MHYRSTRKVSILFLIGVSAEVYRNGDSIQFFSNGFPYVSKSPSVLSFGTN